MFFGSDRQAVCSEWTGDIFTQKLNLDGMSNSFSGNLALPTPSLQTRWVVDPAQGPAGTCWGIL